VGSLKRRTSSEELCELLLDGSRSREIAQFFVEALGPDGSAWLTERLSCDRPVEPATQGFSSLIGARQLDPEKKRLLEVSTLFKYFSHRKQLLANALTAQEVADLLSVSRQTVHERIKDGRLFGILESNVMRLPAFQFDPAGPNGVIAGLPEVFALINSSVLGKMTWLTSSNPVFDGQPPFEVLKQGRFEDVLQEARSVGVS